MRWSQVPSCHAERHTPFIRCDLIGSFVGDIDERAFDTMYFRGRRVLIQLFQHMIANQGLNDATHLIVTGCGSGGAAVWWHLDFLRTIVPSRISLHVCGLQPNCTLLTLHIGCVRVCLTLVTTWTPALILVDLRFSQSFSGSTSISVRFWVSQLNASPTSKPDTSIPFRGSAFVVAHVTSIAWL